MIQRRQRVAPLSGATMSSLINRYYLAVHTVLSSVSCRVRRVSSDDLVVPTFWSDRVLSHLLCSSIRLDIWLCLQRCPFDKGSCNFAPPISADSCRSMLIRDRAVQGPLLKTERPRSVRRGVPYLYASRVFSRSVTLTPRGRVYALSKWVGRSPLT